MGLFGELALGFTALVHVSTRQQQKSNLASTEATRAPLLFLFICSLRLRLVFLFLDSLLVSVLRPGILVLVLELVADEVMKRSDTPVDNRREELRAHFAALLTQVGGFGVQ
jgi:hypothetical protein